MAKPSTACMYSSTRSWTLPSQNQSCSRVHSASMGQSAVGSRQSAVGSRQSAVAAIAGCRLPTAFCLLPASPAGVGVGPAAVTLDAAHAVGVDGVEHGQHALDHLLVAVGEGV